MDLLGAVRSWFDNASGNPQSRWARVVPLLVLHLGCLGILWVGWSPIAVGAAIGLYALRAFFVTAFYHRYFSHRTYRTSRVAQAVFGVLGNTAVQRGPLWWAAHHRAHHRHTDQPGDPHSPRLRGLWWSHVGWLTSPDNYPTDVAQVRDLARFPELRWLDRFDTLVPLLYGLSLFAVGEALRDHGTSGPQMLVWGFFVSTTILFHVTSLVNSGAHRVGRRRYVTGDDSRNSFWIALLTLGEGWHNNHHHYPGAVRQGFYWWEIDVTWYVLRLLALTGMIWDLHPVPARAREARGAAA